MIEKAIARITEQQQGVSKESKVYWVGEDLKEYCRESSENAELIYHDLENKEMSIIELEKKIAAYAKKHQGCVPSIKSDEIIRDFYGLPPKGEAPAEPEQKIISLDGYM